MKIAYASDVHLEFGMIDIDNDENADLLILAGDILVAEDTINNPKYEWFFENISKQFKNTILIMGNHEHYRSDFANTPTIIRKLISPYKNIHFLDKESIVFDGIRFFGATFWTDMNKRDPYVMMTVQRAMNDFRLIGNGEWLFGAKDAARDFELTMDELEQILGDMKEEKMIVVAHHAPSDMSIHPNYKDDKVVNYAYKSNLEEFIMDNPKIKYWFHGHIHYPQDYVIGGTRILCNPRGYCVYEPKLSNNFKLKHIEV